MADKVLVIGGGIAGIQASLDLAEAGTEVILVEKSASIGGKMAALDKNFPTFDCSICIEAPKMSDVTHNKNITVLTLAEVKELLYRWNSRTLGNSCQVLPSSPLLMPISLPI